MSQMSNFTESGLINRLFRANTNSFDAPANWFLALCSGIPDDNSTGGNLPEIPNAGAYARYNIGPKSNATWTEIIQTGAGSGLTQNAGTWSFTQASADWGYVSGVALVDSGVYGAGNLWFWAPLSVARDVKSQDTFQYSIAAFQLAFN
jgi:hypothetical protein